MKPKQTADMFLLCFLFFFLFFNSLLYVLEFVHCTELSEIFVITTLVLVECYSLWHESFTIFQAAFHSVIRSFLVYNLVCAT